MEYLVATSKALHVPTESISVYVELLLWKERLVFKQCIPNNWAKFEIKMFSLCKNKGYHFGINLFTFSRMQKAILSADS